MSKTAQSPQTHLKLSNTVGEAKREIEKLKTELASLINTNIKKTTIKQSSTNLISPISDIVNEKAEINITPSVVKQNTVILSVSSPKPTHSPPKHKPKPAILNNDTNLPKDDAKSKTKHYDSKTAQEFIKKQRSQRKLKEQEEQLKKKEIEEQKKQKLQELRQKTLQLLTDNVKKSTRRSRAKSSEIRISSQPCVQTGHNKASPHFMRSTSCRPRSFDREAANNVTRRSVVQDNDIRPWRRARSVSREPAQKVSTPKLHKCTQDKKQQPKPSENDNNEIKEYAKHVSKLLEKDLDCNEKNKAATKIQTTFRNYQQQNKQITSKDKNKHSENIPNVEQNTVITEHKTTPLDKITRDQTLDNKSLILNVEEISVDNKEVKSDCEGKRDRKSHEDVKKEIESIKQKLESSISQTNAEDTKRDKYQPPSWLLPASAVPYPFNFISAVRHKLEIATRHGNNTLDFRIKSPLLEKNTKDISIQASPSRKVNASIQCEIEEPQKNVTPQMDSPVRQSKSSRSHKCRRKLDLISVPVLKSPESLAESKHSSLNIKPESDRIKSNTSVSKHNSLSLKNKVYSAEDSDSDTTKNIPEIPEEELRSIHKSPSKSTVSEYLKNITFSRQSATDISENASKKSTSRSEVSDQLKNITFDRAQPASKKSSVHSDILKNITFDRVNTNDSVEDLKALSKPDYQIDISKVLSRNNPEKKSNSARYPTNIEEYSKPSKSSQAVNRQKHNSSRYPSDIESILSHYSKISSWRQSTALNDSNYTEDFNSSVATHSSLPNLKSPIKTSDSESHKTVNSSHETSSEIKTENSSSSEANIQSNGKDITSVKHSINAQRTISSSDLHLKFPVKQQPDTKASSLSTLHANSGSKHSDNTNSTVHSISKTIHSSSSQVKTNDQAVNHSASNSVIQTANTSKSISTIPEHSPDLMAPSQSLVQTSNLIQTLTNGNTTVQSVSLKTDSHSALHTSSVNKQESQASNSSKDYSNAASRSVLQTSNIPNLTKPAINLKIEKEKFLKDAKNNPNQIHLKFQAEIHLLNSFNKSLQQIVAIEKSLLDTQDKENFIEDEKSFKMANHSVQTLPEPKLANQNKFSSVNYTRGCDVTDSMSLIGSMSALEPSVCSQDLGVSQAMDKSSFTAVNNSVSKQEESMVAPKNFCFGMSIGMFDQLIKDEDNRLEHFKSMLKLRDKALFDRTKGELAWLEIQKKQLRENGQLSDVTMIKKKQRGLIIKLEQERHEMQRLKQAHKQAAKERKNALREQKNIIKHQLASTDHIPTKIKRLSRSERRQSGPLKVYRVESRTELVSETTMSRKSSITEETVNVTTSSVVTQISERVQSDTGDDALSSNRMATVEANKKTGRTDIVREALLMKEAALEKRRKEAEELLEWHRRLKEEETRVAELERQAKSLALDAPEKPRILTGAQLNQIWKGITGQHEKKFDEHKKYRMSKKSLDRFYTNARKVFREISEDQSIVSKDDDDDVSEHSYTAEFEQSVTQNTHDNNSLKHNVVSQLNASNISSDRIQNVLDTSRLDLILSQKNDSPKTEVSDHTTVSEKSLTAQSDLVLTEKTNQISPEISSAEIKSEMSSNSKKSIILSNISIQEMITSLKNAISACQIKSESHSTIDQKNTSLEIQDTNVSSSESQISSDIKQRSLHSSENVSGIPDSQIVSEINNILSKKLSESENISQHQSSNIISELNHDLSKQKSESDIKSNSKSISSELKTTPRSESHISSNLERTKVSDGLPESNIQNSIISSESISSNVALHSTLELIEKIEEHISEIQEPTQSESRKKSNTTETSGTKPSSEIPDASESHIITNTEKRTEIPSSELVETQSEVLIKSDSHIESDSDRKSTAADTSEIVESNILDAVVKSSDIISVPESTSEKHLESLISEEQNDNVSASIRSSKETSAVQSNTVSEKNSAVMSPKSDISSDIKVKSDRNSSSKIQETIPSSDVKRSSKSSTLNENIIHKTKQDTESEVVSEIKEARTSTDTAKVTSELNSTYSENKITEAKSSEQSSEDQFESKSAYVNSELKSNETENIISSATIKDESESRNLESDTQKSDIHISSKTKPSETDNIHISDTQNEQISEKNFSSDTRNSESHIQTENSKNSLISEEVSFDIKQSDDDIVIEITRTHDTSSNVQGIVNKSSNDTTQYTDNHAVPESEYISPKSDTQSNQDKPLSTESNISSKLSQSEKELNISEYVQSSELELSKHVSEEKSQIASLSQSDIHWSIFKSDSEKNYSEFESNLSSENKTIVQSENAEDNNSKRSEKEEDISSDDKSVVKSENAEDTEKEESEIVEEDIDSKQNVSSNSESNKSEDKSVIAEDDLHLCLKDLSDNECSSSSVEEHSEQQKLTPEDESGNKHEETDVTGVSHIDVRKRVSEILADATPPRGDKSPRVQDLYITTYDIMSPSPEGTPEIGSPTNEYSSHEKSLQSKDATGTLQPYTSEAEELLRKQLEIEQEIKRLERQQQDLPYMFMREIPNKPPPPYKPPEFPAVTSVIPARADQVKKYVDQAATVLYPASVNGTLLAEQPAEFSTEDKMNSKRFVFDLCKEIALDLCKPTCDSNVPSWKRPKNKFNALVCKKPVNKDGLISIMNKKVLQLLNFEPVIRKDSLIVRWSRKKRDHVDEILVLESQTEEANWTNYDVDEQIIKDNLTSEILNSLISETAQIMNDIMNQKKRLF